jgi:DNA gyrase subunit A
MGRTASGVRGITLASEKDEVVGMICVENEEANVLVVSANGYGKRSEVADYRITNRGGKGVKTINVTDKTGELIAMKNVTDDDDLMIITRNGITIRMHVDELRVMGRATQGVKVISLRDKDDIAAVAKVYRDREEEDAIELDEDGNPINTPEGDTSDSASNEEE